VRWDVFVSVSWRSLGCESLACLPEPTDKMKDTPGGLQKGRKKNFRSPVVSFMSTLPLFFWKVSFGESNRFAHQEMVKAKARRKTENNICGAKWKDITLGEFMVFFGILLQMCLFPLPGHSYVLYWAYGDVMFPFVKKMQLRRFQQIRSAALTNASICYFLKNPELKKKEGNRRHVYAAIANFLVEQGETYDWEEQFGSKDNNVHVFQPDYDSDDEGGGLEDDAMDDQLLRDLGVDRVTPATGHGGPTAANGPLCQPVNH
jgi:hypothetical protein